MKDMEATIAGQIDAAIVHYPVHYYPQFPYMQKQELYNEYSQHNCKL